MRTRRCESLTTGAATNLHEELASLLVAARNDTARRLRKLGIPLAVAEAQTSVERDPADPNGWGSSRAIDQQNILASSRASLVESAPLLSHAITSTVSEAASHIADSFRESLPFFSPFEGKGWMLTTAATELQTSPASFDNDAADWTVRHLLLPALWKHLKDLPGLKPASARAAHSFASDVLAVARANSLSYRLTIPLAGIRVVSRVATTQGQASLRQLTAREQGTLLTDWGLTTVNFGSTVLPLVVLELTITTPRTAQNPDPRELLSKWLCAFFLNGYDVTGYRAQLQALPSWVLPMSMNIPLALPAQPASWPNVTSSKLVKIFETVRRLGSYSVADPHSEHDLALHRFSSGVARASHVDGVLDFVIALESLLLPYDENARRSELGYRFRVHGAHLLSQAKSQRRQTARQLSDLYGLRSRLVHGSSYPAPAEIETGWTTSKEFARRGLHDAVMNRFPTAEQFNKMTLGV
jgi:hypothetical protein